MKPFKFFRENPYNGEISLPMTRRVVSTRVISHDMVPVRPMPRTPRHNFYSNMIIEMLTTSTQRRTNIFDARKWFVEDNTNKSIRISGINNSPGPNGNNNVLIYYSVQSHNNPREEHVYRTYLTRNFYNELTNGTI